MAEFSLLVQNSDAPRRGILLVVAAAGALFALYLLNGGSYLPAIAIFGVVGAIVVYKSAARTRLDRQWLIVPLALVSIFVSSFFLEGAPRAALHYGAVILFC